MPELVDPGPDYRDAEQEPKKRFPWSKPKTRTSPTLKDRRELTKAHRGIR